MGNLHEHELRDDWIECYLSYLPREHSRLGGGSIGWRYLRCAEAAYCEFQSSRAAQARFRTWLAIRTCCGWLAQLSKEGMS